MTNPAVKVSVEKFLSIHKNTYDDFYDLCSRLTCDQLWTPACKGLSIANILCHVAEMEGYWIDWGLNEQPFDRNREIEFTRSRDLTTEQIIARLKARRTKTADTVAGLKESDYLKVRSFHNEELTGIAILEWHLHHLGIHVGHLQMKEQELGPERY